MRTSISPAVCSSGVLKAAALRALIDPEVRSCGALMRPDAYVLTVRISFGFGVGCRGPLIGLAFTGRAQ